MKKGRFLIAIVLSLTLFFWLGPVNLVKASVPQPDYFKLMDMFGLYQTAWQYLYPDEIYRETNRDRISSGWHTLGPEANDRVEKNQVIDALNQSIDAYAQGNISAKLTITIRDPNLQVRKHGLVSSGQFLSLRDTDLTGTGSYNIRWVDTNNKNWKLAYYWWHHKNLSTCDGDICISPDSEEPSVYSFSFKSTDVEHFDDFCLTIPSDEHKQLNKNTEHVKTVINFYELNYVEFFDDLTEQYVYYAKNYRPGDIILVRDTVYEKKYNYEWGSTVLIFKDEITGLYSSIDFNGYLHHINEGDVLTFQFKVLD